MKYVRYEHVNPSIGWCDEDGRTRPWWGIFRGSPERYSDPEIGERVMEPIRFAAMAHEPPPPRASDRIRQEGAIFWFKSNARAVLLLEEARRMAPKDIIRIERNKLPGRVVWEDKDQVAIVEAQPWLPVRRFLDDYED